MTVFVKKPIRELCTVRREHVVPQANVEYTLYSLPAFDNSQKPELVDGKDIKSSKLAVESNIILFNKLNVKFRRVWNVHEMNDENAVCSTEFIPLKANQSILQDYLYYNLISDALTNTMDAARKGTSCSQQRIDVDALFSYEISVPPIAVQEKIVGILLNIDRKIKQNEAINHNLEQQVLALYRQMFVDSPNDNRKICRADEYFDISIGKTPPRKEHEWFKIVRADNIVWVSIADMGNCGLFIGDSSEYLTPGAVKKFNVVTVPDNTVLLSFKLTVGRIAITDGQMTTNEAIAHFKTDNKIITEYLYCYLKSYNFQTLGSTSSIATAVNSKIIKAMPFVVPTDAELSAFHDFAAPAFGKIKACQHENTRLAELRNSLLPKLMSGEIDVSNIKL